MVGLKGLVGQTPLTALIITEGPKVLRDFFLFFVFLLVRRVLMELPTSQNIKLEFSDIERGGSVILAEIIPLKKAIYMTLNGGRTKTCLFSDFKQGGSNQFYSWPSSVDLSMIKHAA